MASQYQYEQHAQQAQQPQGRSRPRSRLMSWGGNKQMSGEDYRPQVDTQENPRDKMRYSRNLTTHADPSKAIHEVEPGQAQFATTTIDSIRGMQHLDFQGNVITDADLSNPTRPRLERPLDTIRAFEAAAEGRKYDGRPETSMGYGGDRRSSYYQGYGGARTPQPRFQDDGYGGRGYGGHPAVNGNHGYGRGGMRPDSSMDHGYSPSPGPSRAMQRNTSDPALQGQNGQYYGNHNQYETATNGSGSGHSYGTEPWANSTDPSSVNSSMDRLAGAPPPPPKHDMADPYGQYGYGGGQEMQQHPIQEEGYGHHGHGGHQDAYGYDQGGYGGQYGGDAYGGAGGMAPPPPPHNAKPNLPRQPSKLQSARRTPSTRQQEYDDYGMTAGGGDEKRKSWLKRRFSKNG